MAEVKHVGKIKNTGSRVAVVFRTLPGESDTALVVNTAQLPDMMHDSLMTAIETEQAQADFELGEYLFRASFPDGRNMLVALQQDNRLSKESTSNVLMTPTPTTEIALDQLNTLIAEQKNVAVDQLYTFVSGAPQTTEATAEAAEAQPEATATESLPSNEPVQAPNDGALSDTDLAKSLRSQADSLYKEAARMRREADELDPPTKKATKKKVAESA